MKRLALAAAIMGTIGLALGPASAQTDRMTTGTTHSAKKFAPGQKQTTPGSAKKFAPGQRQTTPGTAKNFAPGQLKQHQETTGSSNRSIQGGGGGTMNSGGAGMGAGAGRGR